MPNFNWSEIFKISGTRATFLAINMGIYFFFILKLFEVGRFEEPLYLWITGLLFTIFLGSATASFAMLGEERRAAAHEEERLLKTIERLSTDAKNVLAHLRKENVRRVLGVGESKAGPFRKGALELRDHDILEPAIGENTPNGTWCITSPYWELFNRGGWDAIYLGDNRPSTTNPFYTTDDGT